MSDDQVSWDKENRDYTPPIVPDFRTAQEKLEAKGVLISDRVAFERIGMLSNRQAVETYGEAILDLRHPLGRTGLNGTGVFWNAGNSATADFALGRRTEQGLELALIYNRGRWGLPGGFLDPGEDADDRTAAGLRECCEETGLDLSPVAHMARPITEVHIKPQSKRSVDFGFISNQVIGLLLPKEAIDETLHASDDAEAANWFTVQEIADLPNVSPDHRGYIHAAAEAFSGNK